MADKILALIGPGTGPQIYTKGMKEPHLEVSGVVEGKAEISFFDGHEQEPKAYQIIPQLDNGRYKLDYSADRMSVAYQGVSTHALFKITGR